MTIEPQNKLQRRVAGYHDIRMDGLTDLVCRAKGASVLDIGCNRGLVGFEFANNGAALVHGCDIYEPGLETAKHLFCDLRSVENHFAVVDLTKGPAAFKDAFGDRRYDIVLMIATYHKLKRVMKEADLTALMQDFAKRTVRYFAWRGPQDDIQAKYEQAALDKIMKDCGLICVHSTAISDIGRGAIWERK